MTAFNGFPVKLFLLIAPFIMQLNPTLPDHNLNKLTNKGQNVAINRANSTKNR